MEINLTNEFHLDGRTGVSRAWYGHTRSRQGLEGDSSNTLGCSSVRQGRALHLDTDVGSSHRDILLGSKERNRCTGNLQAAGHRPTVRIVARSAVNGSFLGSVGRLNFFV